MSLRRRAPNGRARPVAELDLGARALEVAHAIAEIDLRVGDRAIVDGRADLLEDELEEQAGLQVADVLVELFGEVALEGRDGLRRGVLVKLDAHRISLTCDLRSWGETPHGHRGHLRSRDAALRSRLRSGRGTSATRRWPRRRRTGP